MAKVYRSSVTGKWVKKSYAERYPDTTVAETANWLRATLHRVATAVKPGA